LEKKKYEVLEKWREESERKRGRQVGSQDGLHVGHRSEIKRKRGGRSNFEEVSSGSLSRSSSRSRSRSRSPSEKSPRSRERKHKKKSQHKKKHKHQSKSRKKNRDDEENKTCENDLKEAKYVIGENDGESRSNLIDNEDEIEDGEEVPVDNTNTEHGNEESQTLNDAGTEDNDIENENTDSYKRHKRSKHTKSKKKKSKHKKKEKRSKSKKRKSRSEKSDGEVESGECSDSEGEVMSVDTSCDSGDSDIHIDRITWGRVLGLQGAIEGEELDEEDQQGEGLMVYGHVSGSGSSEFYLTEPGQTLGTLENPGLVFYLSLTC